MTTFMTLVGMTTLILVAFLSSTSRKSINIRTVGFAFALQFIIGALVLYFPLGKDVLVSVSTVVTHVISYAKDGTDFLFGSLASDKMGFVFALSVLPIIVFFSSLVAVLYYVGIMSWVIKIIGGGLQNC